MRTQALIVVGLGMFLGACNLLTGANDFVIDGDDDGGNSDDGDGNDGGDGDGDGAGAAGGSGSGNGAQGSGPEEQLGDATGVAVTEVAFYQGVKSTVFADGAAQTPTVSLVASRPAVARVFVDVTSPTGAPILARLTIGANAPLELTVNGLTTSSENDIGSTINFDVPASYLGTSVPWRVELLEAIESSAGPNPAASTPEANLPLQSSHVLKVTLIPVRYQADGSNRLPDTSQQQIDAYRHLFMQLYPATDVVVAVGPTFGWNGSISAGGGGWESLLNAISSQRQSAAADFDEFYYGIFRPTESIGSYCGNGCVAGLGFIGEPNGEYSRAAIGLGYSGDGSTWTAVHEVGHNHGRPHSPCGGVSGADPGYPHSGGNIGVWGMDIFTKSLIGPTTKDFMGYCDPAWISDYVYERVLDFMQATGGQQLYVPPEEMNQTYERITFGVGGAEWLEPLTMKLPPMGPSKTVTVTTADGETQTVQGHFYAYDHIDGGVLFLEQGGQTITSVAVDLVQGGIVKRSSAVR